MIKKDDPRLTAFVLGELDANEASQIQDAIDASPKLQTFVEEIRETVGMLHDQYALDLESMSGVGACEGACELLDEQRAAILLAGSEAGAGSESSISALHNKANKASVADGAKSSGSVLLRWVVAAGIGAILASLAFYAGNDSGNDSNKHVAKNGSGSEGVLAQPSREQPSPEQLSPEQQIVLQSSKYPTETWEQYVKRMHTIGLVDAEQLQAWKEGEAIEVTRKFPTHLTRAAETVGGDEQEEGRDGEEQVATRWIPYIDDFEFRFTIPATGESPDDQTLVAFSDLWFDAGGTVRNTLNGQRLPELQTQFQFAQRPRESIEAYARRLMLLGKITPEQLARVQRGESVPVELPMLVTRFRNESRTRLIPVTRTRTETKTRTVPVQQTRVEQRTRMVENEAGEMVQQQYSVSVPYTENVTQNYTVNVPYTENVAQNYTVQVPYQDEITQTITLGSIEYSESPDLASEALEQYSYFERSSGERSISNMTGENGRGAIVTGLLPSDDAEIAGKRNRMFDSREIPLENGMIGGGNLFDSARGGVVVDGGWNGQLQNGEFQNEAPRAPVEAEFLAGGEMAGNRDRDLGMESSTPLGDRLAPVENRPAFEDMEKDEEELSELERGKFRKGVGKPIAGEINKRVANGKSWKRVAATANTTRLMIGDRDELDMRGMQVNVQVDGFRARVLIDTFYYNDRDQQLEGNFKLRLPDDASLYYFAFGQSSFGYVPNGELAGKEFIQPVQAKDGTQFVSLAADKIAEQRKQAWDNVKEARMVPKEKAAFAYQQTVKRRVDPALVEWSGAGVFAARVFPLAPQKLHRIVVGYDVNLTTNDGGLTYRLDLPEQLGQCRVALNVSQADGAKYSVTPEVKPTVAGESRHYLFTNSKLGESRTIELEVDSPGESTLLTTRDKDTGDYWAGQLQPKLPVVDAGVVSHGVFLVDTSLSSNPDKFNVWLKLLQATLNENRDSMKQFAVLVFNVESYFWRDEYVENTPENVDQLIADLRQLALEGATDLYGATKRLTTTEWVASDQQSPSLFLLSDGAATWGETDLRLLQSRLADSDLGSLFAYQTGLTGTAINSLRYLADQSGGAVFSVVTEDEVIAAATAHRKRAWKIETISVEGGSDVLTAGRIRWVYPGQTITMVGRGDVAESGELVLTQGEKKKVIPFEFENRVESGLASRMYGYVAVGQLESLGASVEQFAAAYARHFRVTGQTCSLLMLESEADYERFKIVPQEDLFVIKSKTASSLVEKTLLANKAELVSPKARLVGWVGKLQEMPGFEFKMPTALALAIDDIQVPAISQPLVCENRKQTDLKDEFIEHLCSGKLDYEVVLAESKRRGLGAAGDAIKALSSLVESNPGDLTLARDLAFVAMELDHPAHAYGLLRRVVTMRPFEPTVYPAMAKCLTDLGEADMALVYYEIAIEGKFPNRGEDYRKIVTTEYVNLLRKMVAGELSSNILDYAKARLESLEKQNEMIGENDIVITMMWNVDQSDVDLHVIEPSGEDCHFGLRQTKSGGQITRDITDGFGPEMYWIRKAPVGKFAVKVKYYGNQANRTSMRSKVYLTIYRNYGRENQTVRFKTVELDNVGQLQDVLTIGVEP